MPIRKMRLLLIIASSIFVIVTGILIAYYNIPRTEYRYYSETDSYAITKVIGNYTNYQVKETYKDKKVTRINRKAFANSKIKSIGFGSNSNISFIGQSAFASCKKLSSIELPSSIERIEQNAFCDCVNLEKVVMPKCKYLGGAAFFNCSKLASITLSDNLFTLGTNTFFGTIIEEISLPSSLEIMYTDVFYNATSLKKIYLYNKDRYNIYDYLGNITPEIIDLLA